MVDACGANGILPFYGPFGDIKDTVACEDQFRNAYLLGCVGAWSLHPVQIAKPGQRILGDHQAQLLAHRVGQRVADRVQAEQPDRLGGGRAAGAFLVDDPCGLLGVSALVGHARPPFLVDPSLRAGRASRKPRKSA